VVETCPKIAQLRPPVEGRQPLRLAIEANKLPTGGLIALMALLALILFGVAPLFTLPSVPHRGPYLAYFAYFAYFYRRRSKRAGPRDGGRVFSSLTPSAHFLKPLSAASG
jgi:hypothetical protein